MAEAIQAGVQAGVQAALAANAANAAHVGQPQRQHRNNNPVFDEQDDDIDEENPFGDGRPHRQQQHGRHKRNNDDLRWTSCLKREIPEFNGGS